MENRKINQIFKIIMLVILTSFITFMITIIGMSKHFSINENQYIIKAKSEDGSLTTTLQNFRNILENKYIGEINEEQLVEGAIKGYVQGLGDPYTEYLTKGEMTSLSEETEGEYMGIGIYITNNTETNQVVVLRAIGNSPAYKAGLLTGDIIKTIDGTEYKGEQLNEAANAMKGQAGTTVKIKVVRDNQEIEYDITREKIKLTCVSSKIFKNNIGYLKITSFDGGCAKEFHEKYKELEKQGIKSLIIDLRFNGGGLVEEAIEIGELVVDADKILLITKNKSEKEVITKSKSAAVIKIPITVLVNEYTASASEILTGILQENLNSKVIGQKTYGKGVIQTVYTLSDGSGLKITTDEYYTPKHNKINEIGIKPDIEVKLPEEWQYTTNIEEKYDTQLQKALEIQ